MSSLIVVHWLAKYVLNTLALVSKLVISSLLTSKGGMLGNFFLFLKIFSVVQYDFIDLQESPSIFPRRTK